MTDCKSDYAGLAQYNNGIAFKPWNTPHTYNRANPPVLSTLKNNVYGRMNTSGYHTLKNGYISYRTNCTNVTIPPLHRCMCPSSSSTRENYNNISKPKVIVLSADEWCGFSKLMTAQEDKVKKACKEAGFDVEFVNGLQNKQKLDELAKQHGVTGFPTTLLHNNGKTHKISGMMKPDELVKKLKEKKNSN